VRLIGALLLLNFVLWVVLVLLRLFQLILWSGWLVSMPLIVDELAMLIILLSWSGRHS
jgi:hypothetical protein